MTADWNGSGDPLWAALRLTSDLSSDSEHERRLLSRAVRLARGERGERVPMALLDAVLLGRLPVAPV